jgi:hypothetical protein
MNLRYKLLSTLCRLLRHPDHTEAYANGSSHTRCMCGHISFYLRSFRTGHL